MIIIFVLAATQIRVVELPPLIFAPWHALLIISLSSLTLSLGKPPTGSHERIGHLSDGRKRIGKSDSDVPSL